jgi:acetylornithine aminotransferase
MRLNPALERMQAYPFVRLEEERDKALSRLGRLIDFGVGDPREETPEFIRRALVDALRRRSSYPKAVGLPEYRRAVAAWFERRHGVALDPDLEIIPTLGSKEAIFSAAQVLGDRSSDKNIVVTTEPGYPVPYRSALLNGLQPFVPLLEGNDFLVDLDAIPDEVYERVVLFWVNYPNNPSGAVATRAFYDRLAERAERHGFLVASDEAYSEIYFEEPPVCALTESSREHVAVFTTLSKRSAMTGYRAGAVAGPRWFISALRRYRPLTGTAPQEFVQRAGIAAFADETHVERMRAIYRSKREVLEPYLISKGLHTAGSKGTFYLWIAVPSGETSDSFALRLLEAGVVVAPGTFFGQTGEGYVRMALVPSLEECRRAVELLDTVL